MQDSRRRKKVRVGLFLSLLFTLNLTSLIATEELATLQMLLADARNPQETSVKSNVNKKLVSFTFYQKIMLPFNHFFYCPGALSFDSGHSALAHSIVC